jgi:hypothetical protein
MEHDRCPKGLAGHKRRLEVWRREFAFRALLFAAAAGYAVVIVALASASPSG